MSVETIDSLKEERDLLKQELERLSCELEQTTHDKNLSAEYGLALLDEKKSLQLKCEELEACYDAVKLELDILREVNTFSYLC